MLLFEISFVKVNFEKTNKQKNATKCDQCYKKRAKIYLKYAENWNHLPKFLSGSSTMSVDWLFHCLLTKYLIYITQEKMIFIALAAGVLNLIIMGY